MSLIPKLIKFINYIRNLGYKTMCTFSIKPHNNGILVDAHNDMNILDMMSSLKDKDIVDQLCLPWY